MSVIAVKKITGGWQIAADSIETWGSSFQRKQEKLMCIAEKQFAIGGTGTSALNSLMYSFITSRGIPANTLVTWLQFAKEFKQEANTFRFTMEDNSFIAVHYGFAWRINGLHVQQVEDYDAIGSGRDFALTALYLGKSAREACEITTKLCHTTRGPVHYFETNCYGKEFKWNGGSNAY